MVYKFYSRESPANSIETAAVTAEQAMEFFTYISEQSRRFKRILPKLLRTIRHSYTLLDVATNRHLPQ